MNPRLRHATALAALLVIAALPACGDGPAPAPVTTTEGVPASALVSSAAFTAYVGTLAASDGGEATDVSTLTPPTSETDEPIAVP